MNKNPYSSTTQHDLWFFFETHRVANNKRQEKLRKETLKEKVSLARKALKLPF